ILPLTDSPAVLTEVAPDLSYGNVTIGKENALMDIEPGMKVIRKDGSPGTVNDLIGNQEIRLTGLLDTKTMTVIRVTSVKILTGPSIRAKITVSPSTVSPGSKVKVTITA